MTDEETNISPEQRFGAYLQRERELRGIDLAYVARFTRLSPDRLLDLEEGRWSRFAAWVYLRGAVQNYSRAIGLDPHETTVRMESEVAHSDLLSGEALITQENPLFHAEPTVSKGPPWVRLFLLAVVLGAVAFGYFVVRQLGDGSPGRFTEEPSVPEPPGVADGIEPGAAGTTAPTAGAATAATDAAAIGPATTTPAAEAGASPPPGLQERPETVPGSTPPAASNRAVPTPTPRPAPAADVPRHELRIQALERSWVEYRIDGGEPRDVILPEGTSRQFSATREIELKSGNAGGIQLFLDGNALAPLGATGQVRSRVFRFTDDGP